MVTTRSSRSQEIRSKVGHPIIDSDGHTLELSPVLSDYVYEQGGADARDLFEEMMKGSTETGSAGKTWFTMTPEERKENWHPATPWWFAPHVQRTGPGHGYSAQDPERAHGRAGNGLRGPVYHAGSRVRPDPGFRAEAYRVPCNERLCGRTFTGPIRIA